MVDTTIVSGSGPPANNTGNQVRFEDLIPRTDPEQARTFLEALFARTTGYVGLSLLPTGRAKYSINGFEQWETASQTLVDEHFWKFCEDNYARWNAYAQVGSTLRKRPPKGERGKQEDALELLGLFSDLDVKPGNGTFRTRDELDRFMAELPEPTLLINTAGPDGGAHAYWLYDSPYHVPSWRERRELDGWFDYTSVVAARHERTVDHVQDYARILRVPGTVRWPRRTGELGQPDSWKPVELVHEAGPRYRREELLELTEPHRSVAVERHRDSRTTYEDVRDSQLQWLANLGLGESARALLEARLNQLQDWKPLLEAAGWQLHSDKRHRPGSTACRYWTRPGKDTADGWSASTDYGESTVMFVYTDDPLVTPCLVPQKDRFKRITTKYQFALHFLFAGDEARLVRAIHTGKGRVA